MTTETMSAAVQATVRFTVGKGEKAVLKVAATDKSRFGFTAVHVGNYNRNLVLVATDGKALTMRTIAPKSITGDAEAMVAGSFMRPVPLRPETLKPKGVNAVVTVDLSGPGTVQTLEDNAGRTDFVAPDPGAFLDFGTIVREVTGKTPVARIVLTREIIVAALESLGETERVEVCFTSPADRFTLGDRFTGPVVLRPMTEAGIVDDAAVSIVMPVSMGRSR